MNSNIKFLVFCFVFVGYGTIGAQNMFPGASGFGTHSSGAYEGDTLPEIIYVNNLNDSGPGSLREAVSNPFPRIVLFNISGTIRLSGALIVNYPFLFIAGQSAPCKGIAVTGAPFIVRTHDILVQDVRFRLGADYRRQSDCLSITGTDRVVRNVVFDHCSFAFGLDENIGILNAGPGITISNSIIGYGLHQLEHSCGLVALNSEGISLTDNIFAFNFDRNPNIRGDTKNVEILNNLIYNSGSHAIYLGSRGPTNSFLHVLIEKNLYITGPDNINRFLLSVHENVADSMVVFWDDNLTLHNNRVYDTVTQQLFDNSERFEPAAERPFPASSDFLSPPADLLEKLTENSGARAENRDQLDSLIIGNIRNRTGQIIRHESELKISSELPIRKSSFEIPDNPHEADGTGYTVLQVYLQNLLER